MAAKPAMLGSHAPSFARRERAALAEQRRLVRRESLRDFAGVALGVVLGALAWIVCLSFLRFAP